MTAATTALKKYWTVDPNTEGGYSPHQRLIDTKSNKLEQERILRDLGSDRQGSLS